MGDRPSAPTFGGRIQQLRRDHGLTQRELASKVGIDFTYLSKLENDRGDPPGEETIRRLSEHLNTDPEELLALAGKISSDLRARALQDTQFAMLLRRLPSLPTDKLEGIYRAAGIEEDSER